MLPVPGPTSNTVSVDRRAAWVRGGRWVRGGGGRERERERERERGREGGGDMTAVVTGHSTPPHLLHHRSHNQRVLEYVLTFVLFKHDTYVHVCATFKR